MLLRWVFTVQTAVILLKNIFLNSCFIRLEGFNNKISTDLPVHSTWPSGKAFARRAEEFEFESGKNFILFASFLLFFFFFFSFSFHFRYNMFFLGIICFYI